MTSISFRASLAAGFLIWGSVVAAAPAAKAFATVNGKEIPQSVADTFIKDQRGQSPNDPKFREAVREELVRREAVAQAAQAKGLDKDPEIKARIALARQEVLIRALVQDHLGKNPVNEATAKAEYDKMKGEMVTREYKARHILVESEADAKAIIAKLDSGAKFEDLAKDSKDTGSKENGGDLGWNQPDAFVKPFAEAMVALEKGAYSKAPVQSQFGFHVIRLDDTRMSDPPPFDQIKDQLTQHLQQQEIAKLVADIRAKAKVQ